MKLVVTGATGFIGSALYPRLLDQGHTLCLFTRGAPPDSSTGVKRWLHWTPGTLRDWEIAVDGADGIINLSGEPIAGKKWGHSQRRRIEKSRVDATHSLVQACARAKQKPKFLINASAVGYYGPHEDEVLTEADLPGEDFLSVICNNWEAEAKKAEPLGMRVVRLRTGIVLGPGGGALAKMVEPFKFFLGGTLGSGKQWMSWIHLEDEIRLILHIVDNPQASGAINATAPNPVQNKEFSQTLARVLRRPCFFSVPGFALKMTLGDMADMLLTGQRVVPAAAEKLGFEFHLPHLEEALQACMPL
ncbi:MAG TPA: TIGR01777 family oxidoreductase [Candidatus Binatus sp.]|nr:TIGR01777 family oxidoreductase [Candidatus Binatus sp.]